MDNKPQVKITLLELISLLDSTPQWLFLTIESTLGGMVAKIEDLITARFDEYSTADPNLNQIIFSNENDNEISITGYFNKDTPVFLDEDVFKQLKEGEIKCQVKFVLTDNKAKFVFNITLENFYNDHKN